MALEDFFSKESKARAKQAVEAIESQTAAEIVVVVRRRAAEHREAELMGGIAGGFIMLIVVLFHPHPFATSGIPIRVALAGLFSAALVAWLSPLKRMILSKEKMANAVRVAARGAFVDLGVSKTRGRSGVLVLVSALERRCEIVCDVGVDVANVADAQRAMQRAVDRFDYAAFIAALESLGPALSSALPRAADDENELPDEVVS